MKLRHLHDWDLSPTEAREVQDEMVGRLELTSARRLVLNPGDLVMGVDNSYLETAAATTAFAAAVVMTWPDLEIVEVRTATKPVTFPYIPGLLTFRELPVLIEALEQVERDPALIFADGPVSRTRAGSALPPIWDFWPPHRRSASPSDRCG